MPLKKMRSPYMKEPYLGWRLNRPWWWDYRDRPTPLASARRRYWRKLKRLTRRELRRLAQGLGHQRRQRKLHTRPGPVRSRR